MPVLCIQVKKHAILLHGTRKRTGPPWILNGNTNLRTGAESQVNAFVLQSAVKTPRPLCTEGDRAGNWRTWRQMWNAYATVSPIDEQPKAYQITVFIMSLGEDGLESAEL